ncbi:MAG: chromosome segregation protein SMC [Opitutaceae bacterium]|nr:chromosome segregation protein SMC [Opitutaceae bacterium]
MNKLALVDANLSRVTDVVQEVFRQIGSLKRQASKAVRYKKLSHRLNHLYLAHANFQYGIVQASVGELERRAHDQTSDVGQFQEELSEKETALSERKVERQTLSEQIQEAQQGVFDLRSQKEQALNEGQLAEIKKSSLLERIEQAKGDLVSIESQLGEIAQKVDSGEQDKQLHLDILGGSDEVFQVRNDELEGVEAKLKAAESDLQKTKWQLIEAEKTARLIREESSKYEIEEKTTANRHEHLLKELADQEESESSARNSLEGFQKTLAGVEKKRETVSQQLAEAREKTVSLSGEFRNLQLKIQESDRGIAQKTARLKLLQQLQEKFEGFGEGAKVLLKGGLGGVCEGQIFKPVTSGLVVESGYEKAVEALLGSAVEAVSVTDAESAREILTQFEEQKIGAGVLSFPVEGIDTGSAVKDLPAFLRPAAELVSFSSDEDSRSTSLLKPLLGSCYVVDKAADFLSFWKDNQTFQFLFVATQSGELIDGRGLFYGGYRKGGDKSILQRETELRRITKEIEVDQKILDGFRVEAEALNKSLEESEKAIESARQQSVEIERESSIMQAEERNAERTLENLSSRRQRLEQEQALIIGNREKNAARFKEAQGKLSASESQVSESREIIDSIEEGLVSIREDRDSRRESLAQARFDLAEKRQKLDTLSQGLTEMEQRKGTLQVLESSRKREVADWTEQIGSLEQVAQNKIAEVEALSGKLVEAQETVEKIRTSLKEIEEVIQKLEQEQTVLRERSEGRRSALSQSQVKLAEERSRLHFLLEEVTREYQVELKSINWRMELWLANQPPEGFKPLDLDDAESPEKEEDASEESKEDELSAEVPVVKENTLREPTEVELSAFDEVAWDEISSEVDALRKRIQTIGPVNLVAIEEYSELKERFEFLKTQSEDLVHSKNELLEAIDRINETSQKQFSETFDLIRKNFVTTFQTLFGGGKADLVLVEAEDVLESGIEIIAQPPGTKLKSISLLSGGQRTMTAVGLLFAIYMVKPSPFCVLDELDAPLDESNISRFTGLLKEFT